MRSNQGDPSNAYHSLHAKDAKLLVSRDASEHLQHLRHADGSPRHSNDGLEAGGQGGGGDDRACVGPSFASLDDALVHIGVGRWQILLMGYAGIAWMADAMEIMLLSYVGPAVRCEWGLDPEVESLLTSVVFFGMMIGACGWGVIADVRGRRVAFFATAMFLAALGLLSAAAPNYTALLCLRGAVGVGLAGTPTVYTTLLEWLPPNHRGRWLVLLNLWWTVGTAGEALLAWCVLGTLGWRGLMALSALPLLVLLVFYPWFPESPRYLLAVGRRDEALLLLARAARFNGVVPPGSVGDMHVPSLRPQDCKAHEQAHDTDHHGAPARGTVWARSIKNLSRLQEIVRCAARDAMAVLRRLFGRRLRRTTSLLLLAWFAAALGYYGVVQLTTTLNLPTAGGGTGHGHGLGNGSSHGLDIGAGDDGGGDVPLPAGCTPGSGKLPIPGADVVAVIVSASAELPSLFACALLLDVLGRRVVTGGALLIGAVGLLPLVASAVVSRSAALVACLFVARFGVNSAFITIYVYTPELYPTQARMSGLGLCVTVSRLGGLLSPFVAVDLVQRGHVAAAVLILAGFSVAAALAIAAQRVESAGMALQAADQTAEDEE